jgi:hypothetical protein
VGSDTVTATYSGDTNFAPQTTTTPLTITKATPSFTEAAAPASIVFGSKDTLSVAGLPAGATGTVTFTSGGSSLCIATLLAVSCQTASSLAAGGYPVIATYSGDGNYTTATATGASFTVTKAPTSMTESATPSSIPYGTADTLSVTGLPGGATGTVTFKSGGSTLCTTTLPATSCATSAALAPGTYPVTATYSGDASTTSSKSAAVSITVKAATTSVPTITSAPSTSVTVGHAFTFTVTAIGIPTPNLTLQTGPNRPTASTQYQGGLPSGVLFSALDNGTAILSGTPKKTGVYRITIVAKNSQGTATQIFTLIVVQAAK